MRKWQQRAPAVSSPETSNSRRIADQVLLVGILLALSAVAWFATSGLAGGDMRVGLLTGDGEMHSTSGGTLGLFMATWLVMMIAMMFPSVSPVVLVFHRWAASRGRPATATWSFVTGYLTVWGSIGLLYYGLLVALHMWAPPGAAAVRVGGGIVLLAGLYQLTPLKYACLSRCRSPLSFVMQYGTRLGRGYLGPFRVGLAHGLYCLGCCWSLMVVLVLLGAMNLAWMALIAGVILVEKVFPGGRWIPRVSGLGIALVGAGLVIFPSIISPAM